MKKSAKLDPKALLSRVTDWFRGLGQYAVLLFILLLATVYGFVLLRVNVLNNAQPNEQAISEELKSLPTLHIDESVAKQLLTLRDNSVNVRSLFDNARGNPFQE